MGENFTEDIYGNLPIFTITKCDGRQSIPVPQWYANRDNHFHLWDQQRDEFLWEVGLWPFQQRRNKAVFRGKFRRFSSVNIKGKVQATLLKSDNWHLLGRGRLLHLGMTQPNLFDINVHIEEADRSLFNNTTLPLNRYMSMLQQAKHYQMAIYVEGWCGWADRLKYLLFYNAAILMQRTPCREYFADLMQAGVHYVPVARDLSDLPMQVQWLRANPLIAERLAINAVSFGKKYLTQQAIQGYADLVFAKYSSLMRYKPVRDPLLEPWLSSNKTFE